MATYVNIPPSTGGGGSTWYSTEAAAHLALIPTLTESVALVVGSSNDAAILGAGALDAGVEGGALKGSGTAWALLSKASIYQNVATSKIAVSFQGKLPAIAVSQSGYFGLINVALNRTLQLGTDRGIAGVALTDFILYGNNGASTSVVSLGAADSLLHTWRLVSDGTTVTVYKDGTSAGTLLTAAANFPTSAMMPALFSTAGSAGMALYKVLYSYVGP